MLGLALQFTRRLPTVVSWAVSLGILWLAWGAYGWNREAVFFDGQTYFADGDCYARMTRVRQMGGSPWEVVRHHAFENFPDGTAPHATWPLDGLIWGLAQVARPFAADPLPLAGAVVSPLLGLLALLVLAVAWRGVRFHQASLFLLAVSPMAVQGFLLGRPDHQSLQMLVLLVALMAELKIWSSGRGGMVSAVAWAAALWVSLFEPAILLGAVLLARVAGRRLKVSGRPLAAFAGILLLGGAWDGFRVAAFDSHFARWALNIGELRHGGLPLMASWVGWLVVPAPLLLAWRALREREAAAGLMAWLLVLLIGLTLWNVRWGYFLVLVFALSLPLLLTVFRWRWAGWAVFLVSLWPVAADWDNRLYPDDEVFRSRAEGVADAVALRDAALALRGLPEGGVMAPWWFSPAVVWWSGQPCVAGSSHQSLPGIVDTAEFFLSEGDGREILARRNVRYIIAYEPDRVVSNSAQILGRPGPPEPLARRLYHHPGGEEARLVYANRFFKVFEARAVQPLSAE